MSIVQALMARALSIVQDPRVQARMHLAVITTSSQTLAALASESVEAIENERETVAKLRGEADELRVLIQHRQEVARTLGDELERIQRDRATLRVELAQLAEQHRAHSTAPARAGDLVRDAVARQRERDVEHPVEHDQMTPAQDAARDVGPDDVDDEPDVDEPDERGDVDEAQPVFQSPPLRT